MLRSETNIGPAGGWALALRDFLDGEFTHAWLMDDDIVADPDCLATLWDAASDDPSSAFVVPISIQPDGSVGRYGSWCGFLIAREIVEVVGLPMAELFWWAEDTEYCHWRIPQAGFPRRVIDDRRGPPRRHPPGRGPAGVEVLLRGPQHALLPPLRDAQDGSVPAQRLEAGGAGAVQAAE